MDYRFLLDYRFVPAVLCVVGAGVGAYLGAYFRNRGVSRAIQEDLDELVMKAVTQATKEIEAKMSNDMWDRQKRWEMKRDAFFAVVRDLESMERALSDLNTMYAPARGDLAQSGPHTLYMIEQKSKALDQWSEISARFDAARAQAALAGGPEVIGAIQTAGKMMRTVAQGMLRGDVGIYSKSLKDMIAANVRVTAAIRKELGVGSTVQAKASSNSE
jgi:hypothetical protein